jgi:hypothetical protein
VEVNDDDFHISNPMFKVIVSSLLPASYDHFTESYAGGQKGMVEHDPKKLIHSQEFIGILKEEYLQCKIHVMNTEIMNQVMAPRHLPLIKAMHQLPKATCIVRVVDTITTTYKIAII